MNRLLLCLALASAACSRDLAVPAPSERPVIDSFTPHAGYANAILSIRGRGFDPTPENNVVQFAAKATRGSAFSADGALLVYVPDGKYAEIAGKFSVVTPSGTSDPAAVSFEYLGLGHPRYGSAVGTAYFHHQPPGIGVVGGTLMVASSVAYGVLAEDSGFTALGGVPDAFVALPSGAAGFAAAGANLVRLGEGAGSADLGTLHVRFLAPTSDEARLLVAATDPLGVAHVLVLDAVTLAKVAERVSPHPVLGLAALDDGRAALVGPHAVTFLDAGSDALPETHATAEALPGPVAVSKGDVVVAFPDGTLRSIAPGSDAFGPAISTGSGEPAASLISFGASVAVSKPLGRLVEVIGASGRVETVLTGRPRTLGWDGARVLVADDDSNVVESIDPATGAIVGRTTLSLGLGSAIGCGQGSAVEQRNYRFLAISQRTHQIASIDYNALVVQPPIPLAEGTSAGRGLAVDPLDVVHVVHEREIGRLTAAGDEEIIAEGVPTPDCLLFPDPAAKTVVSLSGATATVLRDKTVSATATFPQPIVFGMANDDGTVLLLTGDPARPGASPTGGVYTVDALEHGGAPLRRFSGAQRYQGFLGALPLAWGPMLLFSWDAEAQQAGSFGVLLDADLRAQPPVNARVPEPGPVMLTPDRYLIVWTRKGARDHVLRLENTYELSDVWDFAAYTLGGAPVAPAFDLTGEFAYIPVPDEDAIEVFQ